MIRAKIRGHITLDYENTIEIPDAEQVRLSAQDLVNELDKRARADIAATAGVRFDLSQVQVTFERVLAETDE